MRNVKQFLKLCTKHFPSPRPSQRHCLTVEGDDLVLTLMLGDTFQRFNISEADLGKPPLSLLKELREVYAKPEEPPTPTAA